MYLAKISSLWILFGHDYRVACVSPRAFHHNDSEYVPQTSVHNIYVVLDIPVISDILGHGEDEASQTLHPVITASHPWLTSTSPPLLSSLLSPKMWQLAESRNGSDRMWGRCAQRCSVRGMLTRGCENWFSTAWKQEREDSGNWGMIKPSHPGEVWRTGGLTAWQSTEAAEKDSH